MNLYYKSFHCPFHADETTSHFYLSRTGRTSEDRRTEDRCASFLETECDLTDCDEPICFFGSRIFLSLPFNERTGDACRTDALSFF